MDTARRILPALIAPALIAVAALAPWSVRAAEPEAVATARSATSGAPSAGPGIADQIDNYLKTSPALQLPKDEASGVTSGDEPRKVHGVVDVAVGSNGYRSAVVQSDIPVGKTGTVSIAVGETRFNGRLRGGYGGYGGYGDGFPRGDSQSLALGFGLDGAALDPRDPRCHQIGEEGPDLRLDQRLEGGRPRPCRAAGRLTSPQ